MKHPPYHLRPNKAIDRLFLTEAIRRLDRWAKLSEYVYYGLGGPFLEEFRLLYELCPEIQMVSIEENENTYKRQQFHLPCGTVRLKKMEFKSFIAQYEPKDEKSIFWLDYPDLTYGNFEDFRALLEKISEKSMLKMTLRAEPRDYFAKHGERVGIGGERFRRQFGALMPDSTVDPPRTHDEFAFLLQEMVQVASQRALPSALPLQFQPVASFYYADQAKMFTITGVVCRRDGAAEVEQVFQDLRFSNLHWAKPTFIDVPFLSTKERLHLQRFLPCDKDVGRVLRQALGYLIDSDQAHTEVTLRQYADFHRYYPYFIRAVP